MRSESVHISIADNGVGMSAETIESLFTFGFSERRAEGGHGFGLYACYLLAKSLRGSLEAAQGLGEGTVFTPHSTSPALARDVVHLRQRLRYVSRPGLFCLTGLLVNKMARSGRPASGLGKFCSAR